MNKLFFGSLGLGLLVIVGLSFGFKPIEDPCAGVQGLNPPQAIIECPMNCTVNIDCKELCDQVYREQTKAAICEYEKMVESINEHYSNRSNICSQMFNGSLEELLACIDAAAAYRDLCLNTQGQILFEAVEAAGVDWAACTSNCCDCEE